jgi:inorganic pyrophosphatase
MISNIKIGVKSPKIVNVIIEIPAETHNKYEYDEELDIIKLDRVLHSPVHYPFDYGFIPETRCDDGDHLDIMVVTNSPTFPGCLLEARILGALLMSDEHGGDEKILAVPVHNPYFSHMKSIKDISPHLLDEILHFWSSYKFLEKKDKPVKLKGWVGRLDAYKIIKNSLKAFQTEKK